LWRLTTVDAAGGGSVPWRRKILGRWDGAGGARSARSTRNACRGCRPGGRLPRACPWWIRMDPRRGRLCHDRAARASGVVVAWARRERDTGTVASTHALAVPPPQHGPVGTAVQARWAGGHPTRCQAVHGVRAGGYLPTPLAKLVRAGLDGRPPPPPAKAVLAATPRGPRRGAGSAKTARPRVHSPTSRSTAEQEESHHTLRVWWDSRHLPHHTTIPHYLTQPAHLTHPQPRLNRRIQQPHQRHPRPHHTTGSRARVNRATAVDTLHGAGVSKKGGLVWSRLVRGWCLRVTMVLSRSR